MPYFAFKMLFAALALGLLVVMILIARQTWRQRQARACRPREKATREARTVKPRAGLGRKNPTAPIPEPAEPPPARRRQLASFATSEREAAQAQADALSLPTAGNDRADEDGGAPMPQVEPQPEPELEPERVAETAIEADAPMLTASAPAAFEQAVLERLELAFEAFQSGEVSLDGYRARVLAEESGVERQIARHQADGDEYELEGAIAAREAVRWCLDWADEHGSTPQG